MRPPGASRRARLRGIVQRIQEIVGARQTGPSTSRAAADAPPLRLVPARPDVHDDAGRHRGWWSPTGMDDVVLVGRAVCLEPLQLAHVVQLSRREPRPDARGEGSATAHSLRWTWQSVAAALAAQERGRSLAVALRDIRSDRIVGRAGYASMDHRARHVCMEWPLLNVASSLLELDAVHLLLRHAFETLRCVRVELHVAGRERRTRRAVSSMGAREEGVLRQRVVSESGHVDDLVCYGILDREWPWVNASLRKCLSRATHRDEAPTGRGPVGIAPRP